MTATASGNSSRTGSKTGKTGERRPARTARRRAAPPSSGNGSAPRTWLGQWNSALTSYYLLIGATTLLTVIGLMMVLSSSAVTEIAAGNSAYAAFINQAKFVLIGLPVLLVATRLPVRFYRAGAPVFLLVTMALQFLIFIPSFAVDAKGNTNWIHFGSFTMQPSEAVKLALVVWLGAVLGRKQRLIGQWRHALIPSLPGALLAIGLVLAGHDLGTVLVFTLLVAGAYFVAGVDMRLLTLGAIVSIAAVLLFFVRGNENRTARIAATYGGTCDATSDCYQSLHGLWGLGTGGFTGVGLGAGREKWSYLPEAHNDFIFSVIGEELGLLGTLLVLGLFVVLGLAMSRVIRRHPDPFVKITTAGVACWIVGQALINIGVVIGLLPVIGVPLPLVSAGGSALITTMAALGMVISFARSEPGTAEALAARGSVVRKSLAVLGARRRP